MIIDRKEKKEKRIEIDLNGPEGNAFALMGRMQDLGSQIGWSKEKIEEVRKEMTSGDYDNLVQVFDKYFGDFVIIYK